MQATISGRLVAAETTTRCAGCGSGKVSPIVTAATADDRCHDRMPHLYVRCAECGQRSWRRQGDESAPWRLWAGKYPLESAFERAAQPERGSSLLSRWSVAGRLSRWRASRRVLARG